MLNKLRDESNINVLHRVEAEARGALAELLHDPCSPVADVVARVGVPVVDVCAHEVVVVSVLGVDGFRPVFAIALNLEDGVLPTVIVVVNALWIEFSGERKAFTKEPRTVKWLKFHFMLLYWKGKLSTGAAYRTGISHTLSPRPGKVNSVHPYIFIRLPLMYSTDRTRLNVVCIRVELRPILPVYFTSLELLRSVRSEFVVQHGVDVGDNSVLLGGVDCVEKLFLRTVLSPDAALLVELAEVVDVVDIVPNAFLAGRLGGG